MTYPSAALANKYGLVWLEAYETASPIGKDFLIIDSYIHPRSVRFPRTG